MKIANINNKIYNIHNISNESLKKNVENSSFCGRFDSSINKKFLKNNIKIVFSDIDGTISEHSDLMTPKTINAVNFLHKKETAALFFLRTTVSCVLFIRLN